MPYFSPLNEALVSIRRIKPHDDGSFDFAAQQPPDLPSLQTALRCVPQHGVEAPWARLLRVLGPDGHLADYVAWLPHDPAVWWLFVGDAPLLGAAEIERAFFLRALLYLYPTPAAWLAAHATGKGVWPAACILRWDYPIEFWFAGVPEVVCEDARLAEQLDALMARRRLRRFKVRAVTEGRAAT